MVGRGSVVVGGGSVVVGGGSVVVVMASVVVIGSVVGRSSGHSVVGGAAKHLNSPVAFSHPQDTLAPGEHVMCTSSGKANEDFMAGQLSSTSEEEINIALITALFPKPDHTVLRKK